VLKYSFCAHGQRYAYGNFINFKIRRTNFLKIFMKMYRMCVCVCPIQDLYIIGIFWVLLGIFMIENELVMIFIDSTKYRKNVTF
jgi:hypothetical protein